VKAPERVETRRLLLKRPISADAGEIFTRYASDAEVTRFLSWPRHQSRDQTRAFLDFSDAEWARWPAGPYLIESRKDGTLLGSTGLAFETAQRASTGYVLAKDSWGRGYATEALDAMVGVAKSVGVRRLYALCHTGHPASAHVLEKCDFALEGTLRRHSEFPNLGSGELCDVFCYSRILD
jgi:RimJ/RimL family protein N-acetyltransferase